MTHYITRYHDFSYGHRIAGHKEKCSHLHGHNGRVHFTCASENNLDDIGRVIDFNCLKEKLCNWVGTHWDHKFLVYEKDFVFNQILKVPEHKSIVMNQDWQNEVLGSIVRLPFNPTAENMAEYLVNVVGPKQLYGTGVKLISVTLEETRKCKATYKFYENEDVEINGQN